MTLDKSKKRGRPAQLLQIAELHAFVDYLSQKKDRSELQNDVIAMLRAENFNFDSLSEAEQILVKEALKPYREHMKLNLLFDEVSVQYPQTAYEKKFVQLFEASKVKIKATHSATTCTFPDSCNTKVSAKRAQKSSNMSNQGDACPLGSRILLNFGKQPTPLNGPMPRFIWNTK